MVFDNQIGLYLEGITVTNNEKAMYTGLAMCRNTEVAQRWSRTQVFLLIHSAALSFAATRPQATFLFLLSMSVGGLALTGFWFLANRRTDQWIVYWQSCLVAFERHEQEPVETPIFSGPVYDQVTGMRVTFNRIVNVLIGFFALVWLGVCIYAFFV